MEMAPRDHMAYLIGGCQKLANRKPDRIVFNNFEAHQVYLASIDSVHFEWEECQTDPGHSWYSHKHNGPGISLEVCVDTVKDKIVWTNIHFLPQHMKSQFYVVAKREIARMNGNNPVCITKFLRSVGLLETPDILVNQTKSLPLFQVILQKLKSWL